MQAWAVTSRPINTIGARKLNLKRFYRHISPANVSQLRQPRAPVTFSTAKMATVAPHYPLRAEDEREGADTRFSRDRGGRLRCRVTTQPAPTVTGTT